MTIEELKILTRNREKRTLEYKAAWSALPENIFETICAFLNRDGGAIVLGALNDGSIVDGVNPKTADQMCKNLANMSNNPEKLTPQFLLQPEQVDFVDEFGRDKTVIVVQVPSSSQVHMTAGRIYDRSVDGDYEVKTDAERSAMYLRKSNQYSENIIYPYLTQDDFEPGVLQKAKNLIHSMRPDHPWLALDDMSFFKQANLYRYDYNTRQEGFTLAALLLLGKQEAIQSMLPYYKVDAVVRRVNVDRYDDRMTWYGNLIDGYEQIMAFFAKHLPDRFYMEGDQRVSLRDKLLREVVANMLIHREYLNPSISMIEIKKKVIIIKNANRPLRSGVVTLHNYEPHPKNPHISNVFVQMGRAEHLGTGVRNIYHYGPLYLGTEPVMKDDDLYRVELTIGPELQALIGGNRVETVEPQNEPQNEPQKLLTERQLKLLNLLEKDNTLSRMQLVDLLGVSLITVRRELEKLGYVWEGASKDGHWLKM